MTKSNFLCGIDNVSRRVTKTKPQTSACELKHVTQFLFFNEKVGTYSRFAVKVVRITKNKEQKAKGLVKNFCGFPGPRGERSGNTNGRNHWKHQETVRFPHARSTDVIGEHFLLPWLQEAGQGCPFFNSLKAWGQTKHLRWHSVRLVKVWYEHKMYLKIPL